MKSDSRAFKISEGREGRLEISSGKASGTKTFRWRKEKLLSGEKQGKAPTARIGLRL